MRSQIKMTLLCAPEIRCRLLSSMPPSRASIDSYLQCQAAVHQ